LHQRSESMNASPRLCHCVLFHTARHRTPIPFLSSSRRHVPAASTGLPAIARLNQGTRRGPAGEIGATDTHPTHQLSGDSHPSRRYSRCRCCADNPTHRH
jgi:hypothetical protein